MRRRRDTQRFNMIEIRMKELNKSQNERTGAYNCRNAGGWATRGNLSQFKGSCLRRAVDKTGHDSRGEVHIHLFRSVIYWI